VENALIKKSACKNHTIRYTTYLRIGLSRNKPNTTVSLNLFFHIIFTNFNVRLVNLISSTLLVRSIYPINRPPTIALIIFRIIFRETLYNHLYSHRKFTVCSLLRSINIFETNPSESIVNSNTSSPLRTKISGGASLDCQPGHSQVTG